MKKKLRSRLIIGGLIAGLAAITTAIVVPVVLNSNSTVTTTINGSDIIYGSTTIDEFEDAISSKSSTTADAFSAIEYQAAFFLYEKEQIGSIEYQRQIFEWDISELEEEIEEETNQDTLDTLNENVEEIQTKLTNIADDNIDYNSTSFGADFPVVLSPISKIETQQISIYNDQKNAFVTSSTYATKTEGENAWPEQRRSSYNEATTDAEAIDYLVYSIIRSNAFNRFSFNISDSYTKKQKDSGIFTFLGSSVEKDSSDESDKVYFISSNSRDADFVNLHSSIEDEFSSQNLVIVRHTLIAATQNESGASLAWSISKESLKKLLSFVGPTGDRGYSYISDLYTDGFEEQTSTFIKLISDNGDGTKKIDGSLGLDRKYSYFNVASKWADGFGFGFLATQDPNYDFEDRQIDIVTQLGNVFATQEALIPGGTPTNQKEMEERIDAMSDEQIDEIFGEAIRDLFYSSSTGGLKLAYENKDTGDSVYLITSTFGIHILNIEDKSSANSFSSLLSEDLTELAENQDKSYSTTAYNTFLTEYFSTQNRRLDYIISYYGEEFSNYITENDSSIVIQDVVDSINATKNVENSVETANSLGTKIESWYIAQLDSELLDDNWSPEDIYKIAFKIVEGVEG